MAHNSLPVPLSADFDHRFAEVRTAPRPWIYPQLLSLDTPLIAVSWQLLFARAFHCEVSAPTQIILALCVWMIYASDHLLDAQRGSCYSERHEFVWRHRKLFSFFIALAFLGSSALVLELPRHVFLGGLALSLAVAIYFAAVHSSTGLKRFRPKEAAVALLFAAGSSISIWTSSVVAPHAWTTLLLFSVLCVINCCMVDVRESRVNLDRPISPHLITQWFGSRTTACVAAVFIATCSMLALWHWDVPLRLALLGASLALFAVSLLRRRLSADAFRFASDLALLVPALLALI